MCREDCAQGGARHLDRYGLWKHMEDIIECEILQRLNISEHVEGEDGYMRMRTEMTYLRSMTNTRRH